MPPSMTPETPVPAAVVRRHLDRLGIRPAGRAGIRQLKGLIDAIEAESGIDFIRMEMGVPGLPPPLEAARAEKAAIDRQVASRYPPFDGIPALKIQIARFMDRFLDVRVPPEGCVPTVGAMHGCYLGLLVAGHRGPGGGRVVFIDPGFPVNKLQARMLGLPSERIDLYDARGERLAAGLEERLAAGAPATVVYSSPNNPSWVCLTEAELEAIARVCRRHDALVIEDLAYVGMDFRRAYGRPGRPPFIPTVARYTDQCVVVISASKAFSLAGQRIGMAVVPEGLYHRRFDGLETRFGTDTFGAAFTRAGLYATTAGVCHSAQHGLLAVLQAANDGRYRFLEAVREYGERARAMKAVFLRHGFDIVYKGDMGVPLADGFYFTVGYPGLEGDDLVEALLFYGIGAISLSGTGSDRTEGIRACVSHTTPDRFGVLDRRLARFDEDHGRSGRAR